MPSGTLRCLASYSSLARRPLSRHQRPYTTSTQLRGADLGPIHQDAHQTFRLRKDGTKLPLPPILDPIIHTQRNKWKATKARPHPPTLTPFQTALLANPFAHALASPVRECRQTRIHLPRALLLALHPRPHPETTNPWLLPVSLTTDQKHLGPPLLFQSRRAVLHALGTRRTWRSRLYMRMLARLGNKVDKMVWREDMLGLVLGLMRKNLAEKLGWWVRMGQLVRVDSPRPEDIERVEDVGCVLFFASLKTRADEVLERSVGVGREVERWTDYYVNGQKKLLDPHESSSVTHFAPAWYQRPVVPRLQPRIKFPPLEYKTTEHRGRKVAVYSLHDLLGEEKLEELVRGSRYEGAGCVVIKRARHNVPVELLLLQLQNYLANPGP